MFKEEAQFEKYSNCSLGKILAKIRTERSFPEQIKTAKGVAAFGKNLAGLERESTTNPREPAKSNKSCSLSFSINILKLYHKFSGFAIFTLKNLNYFANFKRQKAF